MVEYVHESQVIEVIEPAAPDDADENCKVREQLVAAAHTAYSPFSSDMVTCCGG